MIFITIVIGATILVLLWLIRRAKDLAATSEQESEVSSSSQSEECSSESNQTAKTAAGAEQKKKKGNQQNRRNPNSHQQFTHPELVTTLKGHSGLVTSGDFSSNGRHFISAAEAFGWSGSRFDPGGRISDWQRKHSGSSRSTRRHLSTQPLTVDAVDHALLRKLSAKGKLANCERERNILGEEALSSDSCSSSECNSSSNSSGCGSLEEDMELSSEASSERPSNAPSDNEDIEDKPQEKMSRRQRKNKNKKLKAPEERGRSRRSTAASSTTTICNISLTTEQLFRRLDITETQLRELLLPLCASVEERVLNGYPFSTTQGVFIFRSSGYSVLSAALSGCGQLLPIELKDGIVETDVDGSGSDLSESESDGSTAEKDDSGVESEKETKRMKYSLEYDQNKENRTSIKFDKSDMLTSSKNNISNNKRTNIEILKNNNTRSSSKRPLSLDRKSAESSDSFIRKCKRCSKQFVVKASPQVCRYHPAKLCVRERDQLHYACCHRLPGGQGCTTGPSHVFQQLSGGQNGPLSGYSCSRQHYVSGGSTTNHPVLALDCEMVYTTLGFELARVTLVEPSGHEVLDLFVRPSGQVLDYNTAYSGITAQHMRRATGFTEARSRVLAYLPVSTVLIGHSLESDLQALRIIHRRVLDTALLYRGPLPGQHKSKGSLNNTTSHYRALLQNQKQSLKALVKFHLRRDIQTISSKQGHNSFEDAAAALDLVLKYLLSVGIRRPRNGPCSGLKVAPLPLALQSIIVP